MITKRQNEILKVIVEEYIRTAKPVSSNHICKKLKCSSATVRNEMATLEEKGFQVTFQENMQAAMTADEIVTEDLFATIDYNKRVRLEHAKENIAFEQAETQRMEA